MHELSIAQSILDIVHQYVAPADTRRVKTVFVKVGKLVGVVPDSLEFGFSAIVADTPLQQARLRIEEVPFTIHCTDCDTISESEAGVMLCSNCGGNNARTESGTELQVTEIEIGDPEEMA